MMCLSVGLLLERAKGNTSKFYNYLQGLPEAPPTVNTFTSQERKILSLMTGGSDIYAMYRPLVALSLKAVHRAAEVGLWREDSIPEETEIDNTFYFVLSRMSYMRLIPLCDLANAAMPGEENARIGVEGQVHNGREGCAVVTKRSVLKGEELLIDYNHHHAIGMLTNYGCTLGLE